MSEADYMDECQHLDRYDDENREPSSHEVIDASGVTVFRGSRAACWAFKRKRGGFVREADT